MSLSQPLSPAASSTVTTEPRLQVDFSWRKFQCRVSDTTTGKDVYIVDTNFTRPDLEFFYADDTNTSSKKLVKGPSFGTGTVHTFKIDADCKVHDQEIELKPLKKFTTHYTHLSHTYTRDFQLAVLEWTTTSSFTNWDFICLDHETQEPLARFSSNVWAVKKIGVVEFMGSPSQALKEELLVTGFTLFYCMLARTQNIFAFFGAIFASTGPIDTDEAGRERTIKMDRSEQAEQVSVDGKAKVS